MVKPPKDKLKNTLAETTAYVVPHGVGVGVGDGRDFKISVL